MNAPVSMKLEGGCACGAVRYRLESAPLIVHACHCGNCQRQTGAWHAVNALIESSRVTLLSGEVVAKDVETPSGAGQTIMRCSCCQVAVWSNYHSFSQGHGDIVRFIRVGTLDEPWRLPPNVHIFVELRDHRGREGLWGGGGGGLPPPVTVDEQQENASVPSINDWPTMSIR